MKKRTPAALKKNGLKIRVIAIILFLTLVSAVYFSVSAMIENEFFIIPPQIEEPTFEFEEADFNCNILEDKEYLALIEREFICYATGGQQSQIKMSLTEENYSMQSEEVQLIIKLVLAIQSGDADSYNSCFSQAFIDKEGKQGSFTMQQIYDVVITEWDTVAEGSYIRKRIDLEYKIRENNGTLRTDMGSDASHKQHITVTTNNTEGVAKIDQIDTPTYFDSDKIPPATYKTPEIILTCVISVVLIGAGLAGLLIAFKKTKISDAQ